MTRDRDDDDSEAEGQLRAYEIDEDTVRVTKYRRGWRQFLYTSPDSWFSR